MSLPIEVAEAALAILERDRKRERNAITRKNGAVSVRAERAAVDVRYEYQRCRLIDALTEPTSGGAS